MATASAPSNAWSEAKREVLKDSSLTAEDRAVLESCTRETVTREIAALDEEHVQHLNRRKIKRNMDPVLRGLEKTRSLMDVLSEADSSGIFTIVWGCVKIVLVLAKRFAKYFEVLITFFDETSKPLERLQIYEHLSDSERLKQALIRVFTEFLKFAQQTRRMFIDKQYRLRYLFHRDIVLRYSVWKNFSNRIISEKIEAINKYCGDALKEAKLAVAQAGIENQRKAEKRAEENKREVLETLKRQRDEALLPGMTAWLAPVDASKDLGYYNTRRLPGTCNWIFRNSRFKCWLDSAVNYDTPNLLWINAIPGAGKTYLCSRIIKHLQDEDKKIAYFFCNTESDSKRQSLGVLRTWTWQLLQQSHEESKEAEEIKIFYKKALLPNEATFSQAVKIFLKGNDPVYLILDALDECESSVRAEILGLLYKDFRNAKTLLTSRIENDISTLMDQEGPRRVAVVRINSADNEVDIRNFLERRIKEMDLNDYELESRIASELYDGSGGMFLWVRLMCDELKRQDTVADVEASLDNLPKGLDDIYGRILNRIDSFEEPKKQNARRLLQLIVAVIEPLTVKEIANLMAIDFRDGGDKEFNPKKRLRSARNFIFDCCGPLIEVGQEDWKARFSHASVKDFLVSKSQSGSAFYHVDPSGAHLHVARSCLTYLSYDQIRPIAVSPVKEQAVFALQTHLEDNPALCYSTLHWYEHVLHAPSCTELYKSLGKILRSQRLAVHWLQMYQFLRGDQEDRWYFGENEYASHFTYLLQVRDKWRSVSEERTWIDIMDKHGDVLDFRWRALLRMHWNRYFPPIAIAALFNFTNVVEEQLLDGVHPDTANWKGENALLIGANGDSVESVRILLANGADVNWTGINKENAFNRAFCWAGTVHAYVRNFTFKCIEVLLEAGIDVNWINAEGVPLIHYICCAWMENDDTVRSLELLLRYAADKNVDCKDGYGETPLHKAAQMGLRRTTQVLLDHGADPNGAPEGGERYYRTPLHIACEQKDPSLARILINAGANVNIVSPGDRRTPLHFAAQIGSNIVEDLLAASADATRADASGQTPLHYAASSNGIHHMELLFKYKAKLNVKDFHGRTVMDIAVENNFEDAIRFLNSVGIPVPDHGHLLSRSCSSVYPKTEQDILHAYFLLRQLCIHHSTSPHLSLHSILLFILDAAEYWTHTTASCDELKSVTENDVRDGLYPTYVASPPIPPSPASTYPVRKLVFVTRSCDQGWSSYEQHHGSYSNSWTGFRARIRQASKLEQLEKDDTVDDARGVAKREDEKPEEYDIQVNVHAGKEPKVHTNIWRREGIFSDVVRSLKVGDVVELVPYAHWPGWENHIFEARVEVWTGYFDDEDIGSGLSDEGWHLERCGRMSKHKGTSAK